MSFSKGHPDYRSPEGIDRAAQAATIAEEGNRYGRWLVLSAAPKRGSWICRCDCGVEKTVLGGSLRRGVSASCGCLKRERLLAAVRSHGQSHTPTYKSWRSMVGRCSDPANASYAAYGAAGISVCDGWHNFLTFLADMGERPPGCSIDRIDNSRGYEPSNCRWATSIEQQANRSSTVRLTVDGVTKPLTQWARETGVAAGTIRERIKRGYSHARAISPALHFAAQYGQEIEVVR